VFNGLTPQFSSSQFTVFVMCLSNTFLMLLLLLLPLQGL